VLPTKEERCGQSLPAAYLRIGMGAVRKRVPALARPRVPVGGYDVRVEADLSTNIGLHVYRHGWCDVAARAIERLAGPGDVVIDGGANIGIWTLVAASVVGSGGAVHSIEAAPATAAMLRRNVEVNGFRHVQVHELALAEKEGELEFTVFEAGSGYSSFAPEAGGRVVRVRTTTLDDLTAGLDRIGLVKLDLEGAEVRALEGAQRVLREHRPALVIELEPDHLARQGATVEQLEGLLAGYEAHSIRPDGSFEPMSRPWRRPEGEPNVVFTPS
jgi:FkbM family methyltransferase